MTSPFDLLVAGEINPDLILSDPNLAVRFGQHEALVETATMTVGSSAVIFACGAARLGLRVAFVGVVGDDLFGRYMLESMVARGVDVGNVIVDSAQQTGLSVILSRGEDRAILTHAGAIGALRAADIPDDLLRQARHLHVTSYFLQDALRPDLPELFARARSLDLSTSLDTNWDPQERWVGVAQTLAETTVVLPNDAEALALTGQTDVAGAARALAGTVDVVAVKQGKAGALAVAGEELATASALVMDVEDTVGAGDTFDAGFIYGFLRGWEIQACLRLGIACGSLSTRCPGGIKGQPSLSEAQQALAHHGPH